MPYCRDCKYHDWGGDYGSASCEAWYSHPDLAVKTKDHTGKEIILLSKKAEFICAGDAHKRTLYADKFLLNQNFACPYYKRQWWKFWIKEDIDGKDNQKK
jgi:hypothetical protein